MFITAAGVVLKSLPVIHSADYIFLLSFEISKNIQSTKIVRLQPSSKQCFNYLTLFRHESLILAV